MWSSNPTTVLKVRVPRDDVVSLNKICEKKGCSQADFIRKAVREQLIREQTQQENWSPLQNYNLNEPQPGGGYDQTKGRWNPELITSHNQKIRARHQEGEPSTYEEALAKRRRH